MKMPTSPTILVLLLSLALGTNAGNAHDPKCICCSALAKDPDLREKVLFPKSIPYLARLDSYYSANAAQEPWCMVLPTTTSDVSRVAVIISKHQCPFGIRSGAHSAFKGSSGCAEGITVDLGYMNNTTYNKTNGIASIQPGSNWEMVFSSLAHHGVTAVGGRASVVGVGGFVTGGGYSFHTNAHGFACDSVANFEVVLANGTITNANAKDNADLWKALKGSSGNLGFVTRIDQYVVNSTDMWGGLVRYNLSQRDNVFNAYIDLADNMAKDLASQNIVAMSWGSQGYGHSAILSNIDAKEAPPAFEKYMAIPTSSSTLRLGAVAEIVPEFTGPTPLGLYANWIVGQFRNDFRMMDFIDKKLQQYGTMMEEAAPKAKFDVLVQLQPFTQSMVAHGLRKGGNVLGLEHVVADGPTTNWLIVLTADTLETQKKILPLALQYRKDINAHAKKLGVYKEWTYLNYAWADQDPIATYGDDNIAFLKLVAMKVDPDGVFQKLRKTGFKLPV